ncbi:hypothetical protein Pelo_7242 [Pelomyxa schiedti]|nr:hypothetical protein Pelo_7242 [Pelomyxa schiedti]
MNRIQADRGGVSLLLPPSSQQQQHQQHDHRTTSGQYFAHPVNQECKDHQQPEPQDRALTTSIATIVNTEGDPPDILPRLSIILRDTPHTPPSSPKLQPQSEIPSKPFTVPPSEIQVPPIPRTQSLISLTVPASADLGTPHCTSDNPVRNIQKTGLATKPGSASAGNQTQQYNPHGQTTNSPPVPVNKTNETVPLTSSNSSKCLGTSEMVLEAMTITSTKTVQQVTLYLIDVRWRDTTTRSCVEYTVEKRYQNFADLHAKLATSFNVLPSLPGKKMFGSQDQAFVQQRKMALQKYLSIMVETPGIVSSKTFQDFVANPQNNQQKDLTPTKPQLRSTQSLLSLIPPVSATQTLGETQSEAEKKLQKLNTDLKEKNELLKNENQDLVQQIAMLRGDCALEKAATEEMEERFLYSEEILRIRESELSLTTSKYNDVISMAKTTAEKKDSQLSNMQKKLEVAQEKIQSLLKTVHAAQEEAILRERRISTIQKQRNQFQQQLQQAQETIQAQSITITNLAIENIDVPVTKTLRLKSPVSLNGSNSENLLQLQKERSALATILAAKDAEIESFTKQANIQLLSASACSPPPSEQPCDQIFESELLKSRAYITRLEGRIVELENSTSALNEELKETKATCSTTNGLLHERLDTAIKQLATSKSELASLNKRRFAAEETARQLSGTKGHLWEQYTDLQKKLQKAQGEIQRKSNQIDLLRVELEGEKRKYEVDILTPKSKTLTKAEAEDQALRQAKAYQEQLSHMAFEIERLKSTVALAEAEKNFEKQQHQKDLAIVKLNYIKVSMAMKAAGLMPKYNELEKYDQLASKLCSIEEMSADLKDLQEKYFFALAMNLKMIDSSTSAIDVNHLWSLAQAQNVPHKSWQGWILRTVNPTSSAPPTMRHTLTPPNSAGSAAAPSTPHRRGTVSQTVQPDQATTASTTPKLAPQSQQQTQQPPPQTSTPTPTQLSTATASPSSLSPLENHTQKPQPPQQQQQPQTGTTTTPSSTTSETATSGIENESSGGGYNVNSDEEKPSKLCYTFYRCCGDNSLTSQSQLIHTVSGNKVLLILHSFQDKYFHMEIPTILKNLLAPDFPRPEATLFLVDCSELSDKDGGLLITERDIVKQTLFCAHSMLKCTQKPGNLDILLSLFSDLPLHHKLISPLYFPDFPGEQSYELVPLPELPTILHIMRADVTTAHMIMQLVHNYRSQFPFFTVSMALRTWLRAKNEAAVGVVCLAKSITDSENIDLSDLHLSHVPDSLGRLTCRTLDLSSNKNIHMIPKWLALMPNVRLGRGDRWLLNEMKGDEFTNFKPNNTHKLVIFGDTGVGKTTLLRCMMEDKKKLSTKHVQHTGIAVHHDVRFKYNKGTSWTVWDLGGESLSPFHHWFLLSRSVFIIVFDVSKALMMKEPHMAVYRWLNEFSVARSRGSKARGSIFVVGTHMEGIDPNDPKLWELMNYIFIQQEHISFVFLMQLSNGKGWRCHNHSCVTEEDSRCVSSLLSSLPYEVCDDGIPQAVPESWMILNTQIIRNRDDKVRTTSLTWTQFVQVAKKCGVSVRTPQLVEIEQCADFLADIGTIVHFRYHGTLSEILKEDFIIVEPHSFLRCLCETICSKGAQVLRESALPVKLALRAVTREFSNIQVILGPPPFEKESVSFLPSSVMTPPSSTFHKFQNFTGDTTVSGRVLKFSLFPRALFLKAVSFISGYLHNDGWHTHLFGSCVVFSHHPISQPEESYLFMACKEENTISICMKHYLPIQKQVEIWAKLKHTLCQIWQSECYRYEERGASELLSTGVFVVELFPCTYCLWKGFSPSQNWFNSAKPSALPPNLFYFTKDDIVQALKNQQHQLTCGGNAHHEVDLVDVAPDMVDQHLHQQAASTSPVLAAPIVPAAIVGMVDDINNHSITLGELMKLLLHRGNGTTSVLDQVLPISLKMKILHDVACSLIELHEPAPDDNYRCRSHGRVSPDSIIVLSLDESRGPWAVITNTKPSIFPPFWQTPSTAVPLSLGDADCSSPEVLCGMPAGTHSDVWSFGITAGILLDPLKQPYSHITSRYLFTDYNNNINKNNHHQPLHLYPWAIGQDLLRGVITPFPPPPTPLLGGSSSETNNNMFQLGCEIVSMCLEPKPNSRPSMGTILKVWNYFVT